MELCSNPVGAAKQESVLSLLEKSNHCLPTQLCRMQTALQTTKSFLIPYKAKNSILPRQKQFPVTSQVE